MEIKTIKSKFLINSFDQNTYVLTNKKDAVIIDAGAEIEDIIPLVKDKKVLGIFITHIHFDHIWNLEKYLDEFDCDVYIQPNFEDKFSDNEKNCSVIVRLCIEKSIRKEKIKYYEKNIELGDFAFEIIDTPGHSADSVCILYENNLFTGDTVFEDCIGRTDLYDGNNEKMRESLKRIKTLKFDTAYPGHYGSVSKKHIDEIIDFYI